MSLFEQLVQPGYGPVTMTIVGEGGVGKTSLAASMPKPVFIRVEDGMASLGPNAPMAFPVAMSSDDVISQLYMLGNEDHEFETVVIDSITKLNILIEQEIIENDPSQPKSINTALGGYGAGYSAISERHREIKFICDQLNRVKGMNIVFIAHTEIETIEQPDSDPYSRYTIRMHKKSVAHYSDDVDMVAYIKLKTFTRASKVNDKKGKAVSDGTRIITCYPTANHISKNRYGITTDLPFEKGTNPFIEYIPSLQTKLEEVKNGTA